MEESVTRTIVLADYFDEKVMKWMEPLINKTEMSWNVINALKRF